MALSTSATDTAPANGDTAATNTASADALGQLQSETRDSRLAQRVESLGTEALCGAFLREEARVAPAIACCLHTIASLVDGLVERMRTHPIHDGHGAAGHRDDAAAYARIIYVGAGNSGRVAVMDCAELPVTFSIDPRQAISLIAGGPGAIVGAVEDAEDSEADGEAQLLALHPTPCDTVIGISASGRTPFVLGALQAARRAGALTAGITNSQPSAMGGLGIDHLMPVLVGPEFVTGSTRLKAGSAAKQILNMVSTCTMIKLGKTYQGLMLDVRVVNHKLRARGRRIIRDVCGSGPLYLLAEDGSTGDVPRLVDVAGHEGTAALDRHIQRCGGSVKLACAVAMSGLDAVAAKAQLDVVDGHFDQFLHNLAATKPPIIQQPAAAYHPAEKLFLAIDGGGTKCHVSIANGAGQILARAKSGACNVNSVATEDLLDQIVAATLQAVEQLPRANGVAKPYPPKLPPPRTAQTWPLPFCFAGVWAGIAGVDHSCKRGELLAHLHGLFAREAEDGVLRLTSDSMLLASCIRADDAMDGGLSIIAGTGSVATAFRKARPGSEVRQVGRIGGWGHLLGDQGSAFDIGKRAIQAVLCSIGQRQGEPAHGCGRHLSPLEEAFLQTMDCTEKELLPTILHTVDNDPKLRIAGLARVVTRLAFQSPSPDAEALGIVRAAAASLVQNVKLLVKPSLCVPATSTLVLSGALLNLPEYRALLLEAWAEEGLPPFQRVAVVDIASDFAAASLAKASLDTQRQNTP